MANSSDSRRKIKIRIIEGATHVTRIYPEGTSIEQLKKDGVLTGQVDFINGEVAAPNTPLKDNDSVMSTPAHGKQG